MSSEKSFRLAQAASYLERRSDEERRYARQASDMDAPTNAMRTRNMAAEYRAYAWSILSILDDLDGIVDTCVEVLEWLEHAFDMDHETEEEIEEITLLREAIAKGKSWRRPEADDE